MRVKYIIVYPEPRAIVLKLHDDVVFAELWYVKQCIVGCGWYTNLIEDSYGSCVG